MAKKIFLSIIKDPSISGRILLVLAVIAILVVAILLSGPKPVDYSDLATDEAIQSTQISSVPLETADLKIIETQTDYEITTGVIVGAAGIVLIVLLGTILELRRNS